MPAGIRKVVSIRYLISAVKYKSFSLADGIILSSATHLLHIALIKIKDICNSNGILIAKSILKNKEMLR